MFLLYHYVFNYVVRPRIILERKCYRCGSIQSHKNSKGAENWYRHKSIEGVSLCQICYVALYQNPRISNYKGRTITNKKRTLIGYCTWCQNNIFNGSCKLTSMAHFRYDDEHPLDNRIELCNPCHRVYDALVKRFTRPKRKCLKCGSRKTKVLRYPSEPNRLPVEHWFNLGNNNFECYRCHQIEYRARIRSQLL
jgi:hypothetical protein